ncbi:MAG TPA: ADP-ribosylglycohydrolase family protein [Jiangellaceae bacterium]
MSVGDWGSELTAWRRRVRGCLLGGALGDALGAPFEGRPVVAPDELRAWVDSDRPLRWTDDTALQVALADYLAGLADRIRSRSRD